MLDFYIIPDNVSKPRFPGQSGWEYAGGLDDQTFENLQTKGVIDKRFDYYSSFRWDTILVKQIRQFISQNFLHADPDIKKLLLILDKAEKKQAGLIAYGD
jgi:hypothetical protein